MSYFPDREFHLLYICQPKAGKRPRRSSQLISSLSESRTALSLPLMETHANLALHPASRHFMKLSTSCSKALRMCRGICFWRSLRKEDGGKWSGWGQSYNFSLNFMMQLVFFFYLSGWVIWWSFQFQLQFNKPGSRIIWIFFFFFIKT